MKKSKKIIIAVAVVALCFIGANAAMYVANGNTVFDFFTEERMDEVWELLQEDGNQVAVIDGYEIRLERYLYDKPACAGYAVFTVKRDGYDMRKEFGEKIGPGYKPWFGNSSSANSGRFFFLTDANKSAMIAEEIVKVEKTKECMTLYFKFEVTTHGTMDDIIYLCDEKVGEFAGLSENAVFKFYISPKYKAKRYKLIDHDRKYELTVSPFVIDIKGNGAIGELKDLVMILNDGTRVEVVKEDKLKYGSYYVIGIDDSNMYRYTIRFDEKSKDLVELDKIKTFEYDGKELEEIEGQMKN